MSLTPSYGPLHEGHSNVSQIIAIIAYVSSFVTERASLVRYHTFFKKAIVPVSYFALIVITVMNRSLRVLIRVSKNFHVELN